MYLAASTTAAEKDATDRCFDHCEMVGRKLDVNLAIDATAQAVARELCSAVLVVLILQGCDSPGGLA
jgi:hypothetical protein